MVSRHPASSNQSFNMALHLLSAAGLLRLSLLRSSTRPGFVLRSTPPVSPSDFGTATWSPRPCHGAVNFGDRPPTSGGPVLRLNHGRTCRSNLILTDSMDFRVLPIVSVTSWIGSAFTRRLPSSWTCGAHAASNGRHIRYLLRLLSCPIGDQPSTSFLPYGASLLCYPWPVRVRSGVASIRFLGVDVSFQFTR